MGIQKALLPTMVTVAGDDNLNKKEMAEIKWNLDTIDVNVPGTYSVTGTIANGVTTTVKVITRSNKALADLVAKTYNEKDYTSNSYKEYLLALDRAKEVLNTDDSSQKEIDTAYSNLQLAIEKLILIKVDKTALKALIDKASGLEATKYTEATWTLFNDALKAATDVYNDENATQIEVDNAKAELEKAMANLKTINNDDTTVSVNTGDESLVGMFAVITLLSIVGYTLLRRKEY